MKTERDEDVTPPEPKRAPDAPKIGEPTTKKRSLNDGPTGRARRLEND